MINFKILTPAYNCEKKIETTALSVIGQTYKNWEWIVCDDMSTDKTAEKVKKIASSNGVSNKLKIMTRQEKYGEVRNTVEEVKKFDKNDVVVRLDAGDWLTDLGCLQILANIYEKHDPAVLWTAHRWQISGHNISGPIDAGKSVYEQPWVSSHLKTFRAGELMEINHKNFLDPNGNYIMIACDQAVFLPMMENARNNQRKLIFLPMVMYHYDIDLEDPDLFSKPRSLEQKYSAEWIRNRGFIQ